MLNCVLSNVHVYPCVGPKWKETTLMSVTFHWAVVFHTVSMTLALVNECFYCSAEMSEKLDEESEEAKTKGESKYGGEISTETKARKWTSEDDTLLTCFVVRIVSNALYSLHTVVCCHTGCCSVHSLGLVMCIHFRFYFLHRSAFCPCLRGLRQSHCCDQGSRSPMYVVLFRSLLQKWTKIWRMRSNIGWTVLIVVSLSGVYLCMYMYWYHSSL